MNNKYIVISSVIEDVRKRINDWIELGGSLKDSYVIKQMDYLDIQSSRILGR